jgi:hypothetical protein
MFASDLNEAFVTETDNFIRIYDISNSNMSDAKVLLQKQIQFPVSGNCFAMEIDKDIFVYAFASYAGSLHSGCTQLYFQVLERGTWTELQTSSIGPSNENIHQNDRTMPSEGPNLKLFNGFLMFCYNERSNNSNALTTQTSIALYRKISKRDTQRVKVMFQYLKTMKNVCLIEANQVDREHLILRAQRYIRVETYEYLQLDEQFPISFYIDEAKERCRFYQILGPTSFGKLENVRKFAIHKRIIICSMSYPYIIYYFEDIYSIKSEIVNGELIFIEDTILQVYDLEKKKLVKSFRIQNENYIQCVKADIYHFVLQIKNSHRSFRVSQI